MAIVIWTKTWKIKYKNDALGTRKQKVPLEVDINIGLEYSLLELCLRKDVAQKDIVSRVDTLRTDTSTSSTSSMSNTNNAGTSSNSGAGRQRGQSVVTNAKDLVEQETLMLLEDEDASYDSDHAIVLMQQHGFTTGLLYLYEKKKMYNMLLQHYMDMGRNAVNPNSKPNIHVKSSISANVLESETNHSGHKC